MAQNTKPNPRPTRQAVPRDRTKLRKLVVIGMLSGICMVLGLTGYGFIPLPTTKATIMHLPVIIGAILEGPIVGMAIGLIFGLFSIFQNLSAPTLLSFAFINPLVSVLPRILIALTAYATYRVIAKKSETLGVGMGALVGSLTNTIGVLGMMYFLYAAEYAAAKSLDPDVVLSVIIGIATMNGIPEAIVSVLLIVPLVAAVRRMKK
ncbi:MAG: ECF transporter S component [Selenomonadales bacterium]|nr:ECF transporter S component [Selenomonadales bacterium]